MPGYNNSTPTAFFPTFQHSGFYFPPSAKANGFETTDCLECLQILDILIYGRRVCCKAGDWTLCTILGYGLPEREICDSFYFPLFKQSGINYPPTSSVPLSFKKGASFLMLSFNQLSHACPLQEENIPLHSCNLQGLHHPEPRMA